MMKELPSPTFPISQIALPRGSLHQSLQNQNKASHPNISKSAIEVSWAKHQDEVREAQRLRYEVFGKEMGARLPETVPGHDIDLFDDYCEHLLVRDGASGIVIGTYRVLTPAQAKRVGGTYTDTEFDLTRLWGALFEFMARNQLDAMIGCASIPMLHNGIVTGDVAASMWKQLSKTNLASIEFHALPRLPLPIEELDSDLPVEPPALIRGYLRLGAKILGAPAWDPDFNTADLPMLMQVKDLPNRYRKLFAVT